MRPEVFIFVMGLIPSFLFTLIPSDTQFPFWFLEISIIFILMLLGLFWVFQKEHADELAIARSKNQEINIKIIKIENNDILLTSSHSNLLHPSAFCTILYSENEFLRPYGIAEILTVNPKGLIQARFKKYQNAPDNCPKEILQIQLGLTQEALDFLNQYQ